MNNPFLVNDVIYHATVGKGRVVGASPTSQCVHVVFGNDDDADEVEVSSCSFEPWPAPVHKRPLEDGWWVVVAKNAPNAPIIRKLYDGKVYDSDGRYTAYPDFYNFHKFLGKYWK